MRTSICLLLALSLIPATAEELTITGRVVGPDGAVAADVYVYRPPERHRHSEYLLTTTDRDGRFSVTLDVDQAQTHYLVLAMRDHAVIGATRATPGEPATITVTDAPLPVSGTVTNARGQPVEGASLRAIAVRIATDGETHTWRLPQETHPWRKTGEGGGYSLGRFAPDMQVGLCAGGEGWATWWGFRRRRPATPGESFDITLEPEAIIRGRVLFQDQPLVGVSVSAYSKLGFDNAVSDDEGRFIFDRLPPGEYEVRTGYVANATLPEPLQVTVGVGETLQGVEVTMFPRPTIRGRVTFAETGAPVEGVEVVCARQYEGWASPWRTAETGAEGRYQFRPHPGEWQVFCEYKGRVEPGRTPLKVGPAETATVDFRILPRRVLSGTVLGPDGRPVPGAIVQVVGTFWRSEQVETDAQGSFRVVEERAEGNFRFFMVYAHTPDGEMAGVAFTEEFREGLVVNLATSAWLRMSARNEDGEPVEGIEVLAALAPDGPVVPPPMLPSRFRTDADGAAMVGPLPPDQPLALRRPDRTSRMTTVEDWPGGETVSLKPGEVHELPPLVVRPEGRILRGQVLDQDQEPLPGAVILSPHGVEGQVKTAADEHGEFALPGLRSQGDVFVVAAAPDGSQAWAMRWQMDPPLPAIIELAPPVTVRGVVRREDGTPVERLTVSVRSLDSVQDLPGRLNLMDYAFTKEDGSWEVRNLICGPTYHAGATLSSERLHGSSGSFLLSPGETPHIEITLHPPGWRPDERE
ncbi:MAG: carboxypeptidase-like regulatory domain-containing protein [Armatimonadota bacterium]|nr:carboxypeptidase-like regulatory domain-containing protein [Armatimonadota bacterium]